MAKLCAKYSACIMDIILSVLSTIYFKYLHLNITVCYNCLVRKRVLYLERGNHRAGRLPSFSEGLTLQMSSPLGTKERRALPMMITYSDLVQTGIFIVALIGLCYTVFKGKRK